MLVDQMVDRYQLQQRDRGRSSLCHSADQYADRQMHYPEDTAGWMGGYSGNLSRPELYERMAHSDCVLSFGVRLVDSTTGYSRSKFPPPLRISSRLAEAGQHLLPSGGDGGSACRRC
ncbi:hypothetical protein J4732_15835 [Serratia marcescens]|uniref:Uncharacterized protein n=1 Tax=Serratia marcescens TaxID=615 RepID=A0A939NKC8_SERMA|nr:hypothetical protein [Serratia marcescens]